MSQPMQWIGIGFLCLAHAGCLSPYYTDRGALFGGVTGAGLGALAGSATGHPGAGALIGAGVGTVTGAAVGSSLDEIEARNRAQIEARLARPLAPGGVTVEDVAAMSRAGVEDVTIINHVRANGIARPLQSADLIRLQQDGVRTPVVQALQTAPVAAAPGGVATPVVVPGGPPPVIVTPYYGPPYPPPYRWHRW